MQVWAAPIISSDTTIYRVDVYKRQGYKGTMLLPDAIEISSNGTAAQARKMIGGPSVAYEQVVTKRGFSHQFLFLCLVKRIRSSSGRFSIPIGNQPTGV